jgi:hypothetical protein
MNSWITQHYQNRTPHTTQKAPTILMLSLQVQIDKIVATCQLLASEQTI